MINFKHHLIIIKKWGPGVRALVLLEDLAIRLEGSHVDKQPLLVGYMELVDAAVVQKVAAIEDAVGTSGAAARWEAVWDTAAI